MTRDDRLSQALALLREAISILDDVQAPAEIAAKLDHAACEIQWQIDGATARKVKGSSAAKLN